MRRILVEAVRDWGAEQPVAVACSGNFTIERSIFTEVGPLTGNDVTIYSATIGRFLAGQEPEVKVVHPRFAWLDDFMGTPIDRTATVMLAASAFALGPVDGGHPYYDRQARLYASQWDRLHSTTVERLQALTMRLAGFYAGDCRTFVASIGDMPLITFPPFFAGDYEQQYRNLDIIFDWDAPTYPELDADGIEQLIADVVDRPRWIIGLPIRRDDLAPHLRGMAQTTSRGKPIYVYASDMPTRVAVRHAELETPRWPLLQPDDELTGDLAIVTLRMGEFHHVRSMFMDKTIVPASTVAQCWGVLDDGRLIGVYATGTGANSFKRLNTPAEPSAYLLSDLPVASRRYKRLAKLVLYAALSHESHDRFVETYGRAQRSVSTSAFSAHPVSMKYRGLFDILKRIELTPEQRAAEGHGAHRYRIDYWARLGQWSLQEGWAEWLVRHSGA